MDEGQGFKRCGRCGVVKLEAAFAWRDRARQRLQSYCKDCLAAYHRDWHMQHRVRRIQAANARRKRRIARNKRLLETAKSRPCHDCGESYPAFVMDFDHVRGVKKGNVSEMVYLATSEVLLREIAQCELVCANCHRRRSHKRLKEGKDDATG